LYIVIEIFKEIYIDTLINILLVLKYIEIFFEVFPWICFGLAIFISILLFYVDPDKDEKRHVVTKFNIKALWYGFSVFGMIMELVNVINIDFLNSIILFGIAMIGLSDNLSRSRRQNKKNKDAEDT